MPKETIDYSNTIIYKIYCKDETIKDIYVGHTTNFTQRKYSHKMASNNLNNTLKIYNTIRNNGGWENWDMVEIAKYCCKDATEARIKEQFHYEELKSSLNSVPPYVDKSLYFCSRCNAQYESPKQYNMHVLSNKHITKMNQTETELLSKITKGHCCNICDYNTCKITDFKKHLETAKHKKRENETVETKIKQSVSKNFQCVCGIWFNSRTTLWRHSKVCKLENKCDKIDNSISDKELIIMLIKQNTELMDMLKNNNSIHANHTTN
jgi:hypothetical protein